MAVASSRRSSKSLASTASADKGRWSKLKTCVCAASASLGREKSRLFQLEQRYVQRACKVAEKEDLVDDLEAQADASQVRLAERRDAFVRNELAVSQELQALQASAREAQRLQAVLAERHQEVLRQEKQQVRLRARLSKRLERVEEAALHLSEERLKWQEGGEAERRKPPLRQLQEEAEQIRGKLPLRRQSLAEAKRSGQELREDVQRWQGRLEPLRHELQMKEADLDERFAALHQRREELTKRETRWSERHAELQQLGAAAGAARQRKGALATELEELLEEIRQREQMLQEIKNKKGSKMSVLRDDLTAAQLAEDAWRERCEGLEARQQELLDQIRVASRPDEGP
ncbi:unnamed protein product [Durusdinium trenchii]|uniref:Reverse transcriptase domain-containing protein n=2 Tax=Durusdinium trenchii TaxID=1381693 RepID=A0ABP0H8L3_9DINO